MSLDAGLVFEAGLEPYELRPVAAEVYGTEAREFSLGTLSPMESEWLSHRGGVSDNITLVGDRVAALFAPETDLQGGVCVCGVGNPVCSLGNQGWLWAAVHQLKLKHTSPLPTRD